VKAYLLPCSTGFAASLLFSGVAAGVAGGVATGAAGTALEGRVKTGFASAG